MTTTTESLRHDKSGAVAVEFTVAVMPLFFMFFGFWQVGAIYVAGLGVHHAANTVVRAGAVMQGPNTTPEGDGTLRPSNFVNYGLSVNNGLLLAANEAILPWSKGFHMVVYKATATYADSKSDPFSPVTAHVEAFFQCEIPLGKRLACGFIPIIVIKSNANKAVDVQFAHQGAKYKP